MNNGGVQKRRNDTRAANGHFGNILSLFRINIGCFSSLAEKYGLVPHQHNEDNKWYKIMLMDHVEAEHLTTFIEDLKATIYA